MKKPLKKKSKKDLHEALVRSIKRKEAAFKRMSKSEKRVAIAKDVIALLDTKKIIAQQGVYVSSQFSEGAEPTDDVRDSLLKRDLPTCSACALGSMFLATTLRCDAVKFEDTGATERDCCGMAEGHRLLHDTPLGELFDKKQLCLIEAAFEGGVVQTEGLDEYGEDRQLCHNASNFCGDEQDDEKRLRKIMKNIIDHNGRFVPPHVKIEEGDDYAI